MGKKYYYLYFYILINLSIPNFVSANNIYIYEQDDNNPIPFNKMEFLEGKEAEVDYETLKKENWKKDIEDIHSYYNGLWIKIKIKNNSNLNELGVSHWANFEKRLIIKNKNGLKELELLSFGDGKYKYFDQNRIWFDYKVSMPKGEITEIYSFYRTKPLHRTLSGQQRHLLISIKPWEDLLYQGFFRVIRVVVTLAVLLYIFFNSISNYFVSRDNNYLYFSFVIISSIMASIYLMQYIVGFRGNTHYGHIINCLIIISFILFFTKFLNLKKYKYNSYRVVYLIILSQIMFILYDFIVSFDFPNGEYFTNLEKYPIEFRGIGWPQFIIRYLPAGIMLIYLVYISYSSWKQGDKASGYMLIAVGSPLMGIPIFSTAILLIYLDIIHISSINLYIIPATGLLLMLTPISFSLDLSERINHYYH